MISAKFHFAQLTFALFFLQGELSIAYTSRTDNFKSYKEWKIEKILVIEKRLLAYNKKLSAMKPRFNLQDPNIVFHKGSEAQSSEIKKLEKQISEETRDLEITRDLTVSDYFVGYLSRIDNKKDAMKKLAARLKPDEVAEFMNAYADFILGSYKSDSLARSASMAAP